MMNRCVAYIAICLTLFLIAPACNENPAGPDEELVETAQVLQWVPDDAHPEVDVLSDVWGLAPDDIYAVGTGGTILHYDGSAWAVQSSPTTESLLAVFGRAGFFFRGSATASTVEFMSATPATVSGTYAIAIMNQAEQARVTAPVANTTNLSTAETLTINSVDVVLVAGMTTWQIITAINDHTAQTGVTASTAAGHIVLRSVGYGAEEAVVVVSNVPATSRSSGFGTAPLVDNGVDIAGTIGGLATVGMGDVLTGAAGMATEGLAIRTTDAVGAVGAVVVKTGDRILRAVGTSGVVLESLGSQWTMPSSPAVGTLYGTWCEAEESGFAVGDSEILCYSNAQWESMITGPSQSWHSEQFHSIWGASDTDAFAVGTNGTIVHWDGIEWLPMTSSTTQPLHGVRGRAGNDVYAVGGNGTVLHYDGGSWSKLTDGTPSTMNDIWRSVSGELYVVGTFGTCLHYDTVGWFTQPLPTTVAMRAIWGHGSDFAVAVGDDSTILWLTPDPPPPARLHDSKDKFRSDS